MMTIADSLDAIRTLLQDKAGIAASLGPPMTTEICIWPWQLVASPSLNTPHPGRPSGVGGAFRSDQPVELRVLLVSQGTPTGIDLLSRAHRVLLDNPVIQIGQAQVQVESLALAASDLAAIFAAGQVPLRLSSSFSVRASV